jgi:hypothetical protein
VAGGEDGDACCFGCGEGVGPAPAEYDANCSTPSALSAYIQHFRLVQSFYQKKNSMLNMHNDHSLYK